MMCLTISILLFSIEFSEVHDSYQGWQLWFFAPGATKPSYATATRQSLRNFTEDRHTAVSMPLYRYGSVKHNHVILFGMTTFLCPNLQYIIPYFKVSVMVAQW